MNTRLWMPLAVVQGLWVLRRTPRLPAPDGRSGRVGPGGGPPLRVSGLGDSIMVGTGVREQCHSLTATYARLLQMRLEREVGWRVHGRNGATSAVVLHEIAPAVRPSHVHILSCGVNDATRGVSVERFASNLAAILGLLRRKSPEAVILYGGLPPLDCFPALPWPLKSILAERVRAMQSAAETVIARDARARCFRFPPIMSAEQFASDGFHPAERACERWAAGLLELWPSTHLPDPGARRTRSRAVRTGRRGPQRAAWPDGARG
ncbi:MAG: SGNH/GDSL hydrolase family protein [Steroidobacteraceae bacterium]